MKTLLYTIIVLAVLFFGVGKFLLPETYAVERTVSIQATPAQIAPYLSDLSTWEDWTAWNTTNIPSLERTMGQTTQGVGASMNWKDDSGEGSLAITEVEPTGGVKYDLDFMQGKYLSKGHIQLLPDGEGTKVVWSDAGALDGVVSRYFGLMMDGMMGPDFEEGLESLKQKVETMPKADSGAAEMDSTDG